MGLAKDRPDHAAAPTPDARPGRSVAAWAAVLSAAYLLAALAVAPRHAAAPSGLRPSAAAAMAHEAKQKRPRRVAFARPTAATLLAASQAAQRGTRTHPAGRRPRSAPWRSAVAPLTRLATAGTAPAFRTPPPLRC